MYTPKAYAGRAYCLLCRDTTGEAQIMERIRKNSQAIIEAIGVSPVGCVPQMRSARPAIGSRGALVCRMRSCPGSCPGMIYQIHGLVVTSFLNLILYSNIYWNLCYRQGRNRASNPATQGTHQLRRFVSFSHLSLLGLVVFSEAPTYMRLSSIACRHANRRFHFLVWHVIVPPRDRRSVIVRTPKGGATAH